MRRPARSTLFPFFFFIDSSTTEFSSLPLPDALPISADLSSSPMVTYLADPKTADDVGQTFPVARRDHLRSEEHTSELQSPCNIVCRLLLEKKNPVTL